MADASTALIGRSVTISRGILTPPINGTVAVTLGSYSLTSLGGMQARLATTLTYRLSSWGLPNYVTYGVTAELSGYSFTTLGGAQTRTKFSGALSTATGTAEQIGTFVKKLSGYSLSARGRQDLIARVRVTYYGAELSPIRGGANAAVALSGYSGSSTGKTDRMAGFAGTMPRPTLVASGYGDNLGQVVGTLPTLKVGGRAVVIATMPRATVSITGSTVSVEYEAYCFALIDDERKGMQAFATHYTTFPFDRIVRFGDAHYGVAADGLYELAGDDFDGTPIVSVVKTHPTDFRARELKRPISLYLGGRVSADFRVSVIDSETDANAYNYRPVDKTGARNYRAFFGKGIRARYLAYALTNTNGGDFNLDDITPEVVVLRRTA